MTGTVATATKKQIVEHNPERRARSGHGTHYKEFADLTSAGFHALQSSSFDEDAPCTHKGWHGLIRASTGVAANLPRGAVT
jgi:hypothetical protein